MEIYVVPNTVKNKALEISDLINDIQYIESKTRNIQNTLDWNVKSKATVSLAFQKILKNIDEVESRLHKHVNFLNDSANKYNIADKNGGNNGLENNLYSSDDRLSNDYFPFYSLKDLFEWLNGSGRNYPFYPLYQLPAILPEILNLIFNSGDSRTIEPFKDLIIMLGGDEDRADNLVKVFKDSLRTVFKNFEHNGLVAAFDFITKPLGLYNTYNGKLDSPFMRSGFVIDGSLTSIDLIKDILKCKGVDTDEILGGTFKTGGAFDYTKLGFSTMSKIFQKFDEYSRDDGVLDGREIGEGLIYGSTDGMMSLLSIAANSVAPGSGVIIDTLDDAFDISDRAGEGYVILADSIAKGEADNLFFDYVTTWTYYGTHLDTLVTSLFNGDFSQSDLAEYSEWYDKARDTYEGIKNGISDVYETAKEGVSSVIDYAKSKAEDAVDYIKNKFHSWW